MNFNLPHVQNVNCSIINRSAQINMTEYHHWMY